MSTLPIAMVLPEKRRNKMSYPIVIFLKIKQYKPGLIIQGTNKQIHTFVSKSESAHLGEKFEGLEANDTSTF